MDLTSAAEANLNARVRPQIVALRSKTPYPKRRPEGAAAAVVAGGRPVLSVVGPAAVPGSSVRLSVVGGAQAGLSVPGRTGSRRLVSGRPVAAGRSDAAAARTPIKLTRRGRVVVGVLMGLAVAAVAIAIWFAVAGQAQRRPPARLDAGCRPGIRCRVSWCGRGRHSGPSPLRPIPPPIRAR
jgi:hypothetical protein